MQWKPNRASHLTLHEQIYDWISTRIQQGEWTIGTILPSQRKLAETLDVNRSTIIQVLDELKANGILETRIGGSTYVSNSSWNLLLQKEQANWHHHIHASIHEANIHTIQLINEYEQNQTIIRLGTGELSPDLLPTTLLEQSFRNLTIQARDISYSEPKGSKKLRIALTEYLRKRGINTSPESILITSGAIQALQLISVGLLEQQSNIFLESPSYLQSIQPFQSAGMRVFPVKRVRQLIEKLQTLKGKKQSLFYCVPTLNNPSGNILSLDERKKLLELCTSLQIPIIEDDVYHELAFVDTPPAMKSLDQAGQVIYIGSVSKTLSPGLRIGWLVAPEPVIHRLADVKMQMDYGSSGFSQQIVAHWLTTDLYEKHLEKLREQLKTRANFVIEILLQYFKEVATWETPIGGFYIWLRFNEPIVNKAFFQQLIKQNVLINPGYLYDPKDFHHIRLSYAYATLEELKEGLQLVLQVVKQKNQ
ncbi:PLP-dependent aminotransferase family protein [Psychrobacillus sp.]|uniref:aminotransferase-like domain-containing protein n=1 Tax=Psychrobacillus sp. TaxID=1871623 RepID=UPI0028BEB828|nr:PLP-dependent aminotransferase family protein [Psychrobacillus sp.]